MQLKKKNFFVFTVGLHLIWQLRDNNVISLCFRLSCACLIIICAVCTVMICAPL